MRYEGIHWASTLRWSPSRRKGQRKGPETTWWGEQPYWCKSDFPRQNLKIIICNVESLMEYKYEWRVGDSDIRKGAVGDAKEDSRSSRHLPLRFRASYVDTWVTLKQSSPPLYVSFTWSALPLRLYASSELVSLSFRNKALSTLTVNFSSKPLVNSFHHLELKRFQSNI